MVKHMRYFDHECYLPLSADSGGGSDLPIYLSSFKKILFSLRMYINIDEGSPRTRKYFRSYASILAEKKRHSKDNFRRIIHPFSKFAIVRERIICISWMIAFFVDPMQWSIFLPCTTYHDVDFIQDVARPIFVVNALLALTTGYCDPSNKEIVLSQTKIIKSKLIPFVIPEILCTIPYNVIAVHQFGVNPRTSRVVGVNLLRILRYLRLRETLNYFRNILEELHVSETVCTVIIVFLMAFYVIHWSACAMYFCSLMYYTWEHIPEESWFVNPREGQDVDSYYVEICSRGSSLLLDAYVTIVIGTTCHFLGAGDGYKPVTLRIEQLSCGFLIIIGFVYHIFAIATIFDILGSVYISESKYQELLFHVPDYIRTRNLPKSMKRKMFMYFEYKFRGRFFKEDEILSTLSEHLRCEVVLNSCENILKKIPLLQGMSKNVIGSVIGFLKKEIYLPNDVVIKFGDPMIKMFWISYGTFAAYFGEDMTEILHFEDGDHFCDNAITAKPGPCTLSVVALEITEVFTLNRKDIKHCTAFLKEIGEKINKISKDKSALYNILAERMTDQGVQNRVLADLRRGRILERDRWRRKRAGPLHLIRDKKLIS